MKHNWVVTIILIGMFLAAQFIGIFVINAYSPHQAAQIVNGTLTNITIAPELPYGMQPPSIEPQISLISIIISFIIAILLMLLLIKIKSPIFMRIWFFVVVVLGISIALNAFLKDASVYSSIIALVIALPLGFIKIFQRNLLVHNITELFIYPGIAAVFVPILNVWSIVVLLLLISAYDIYAVWHSGFMQKLAKYQIKTLRLFAGFYVPYIPKKQRAEIKRMQEMSLKKRQKSKKKIKIGLAILGGGDVVFPIITAGVILRAFGIFPAMITALTASLALFALLLFSRKGKFYPAMPFLTAGVFVGIAIVLIFF
jgi:presenilin-like A22 family membrane protease